MARAAIHPSLPQNDNAIQQAEREVQLAMTQLSYQWTTDVPTLPGVPLAKSVPLNDFPTHSWWAMLIKVGLQIVRNLITIELQGIDKGELDKNASDLTAQQARCDQIEASLMKVAAHHEAKTGQNIFSHVLGAVEEAVEYAEYDAHQKMLNDHACELKKMIDSTDMSRSGLGSSAPNRSLEAYRELFDTLPVPGIAYNFEEDDVFARLRVAGPNSVLIKGITDLPENFPVTAEQYASAVNGDSLKASLADGRVYLCDYKELEVLIPGTWDGLQKSVYVPMALFAVPPGGSSLVPVAIQCGQDPTKYPVFTPSDITDEQWGWDIAKLIVQVADGNYHELFVHLARTHLVMEAFAVATHRHLAEIHPIWALLVPHFEGSLFINEAAATSLIAANGPIDHIFAGTIASTQSAAANDRLAFDFYAMMLPANLASRNVDDISKLPDYSYRDDALLVWNAIHDWATQYVNIYYADDDAVAGDTELAAWASCLIEDGKIKGFKPVTSRAQLAEICTMVMFTGSAQHAAVNFPQKEIMSFAPAVTGAGWTDAPATQSGHDKQDWLNAMLPIPLALEQLNTLWLLGSVYYRPLGDYRSNDFPYDIWFQDPAVIGPDMALPRFQAALQTVEAQIIERNNQRRVPYPYLQPSLIPTSVNI